MAMVTESNGVKPDMAKQRRQKQKEHRVSGEGIVRAEEVVTSTSPCSVVRHQKLCVAIDIAAQRIYGHTELKVSTQSGTTGGVIGLHAHGLHIDSVSIDGVPADFEFTATQSHYDHRELEPSNGSDLAPYLGSQSNAADLAYSQYVSDLHREMQPDLLIFPPNVSTPIDGSQEPPPTVHIKIGGGLENGSTQIAQEAKPEVSSTVAVAAPQAEEVRVVRVDYWVEKPAAGVHFHGTILHTHNQLRRARCWFPCVDSTLQRSSYDLEFTVDAEYVAVSSGKLLHQVYSKQGTHLKTYVYSLSIPTAASFISLVVGPLVVLPDRHNPTVSYFGLPGYISELQCSVSFFHSVFSLYEEYLGAPFPFGCYNQVFIPGEASISSSSVGSSMAIFSADLLADEHIIDQAIGTRIKLANRLAQQWFGNFITPEAAGDVWLLEGLTGFLTDLYIKRFLGNNEARFRRYKANEAVCLVEVEGAPVLSPPVGLELELCGTESFGDLGKIRSWKATAVIQMLEKQMGPEPFRKILQRVILRAQDPVRHVRTLSTKEFRHFANKLGNLERPFLKEFFPRWVESSGCPRLRMGFVYSKRRNMVELAVRRVSTAVSRPVAGLAKTEGAAAGKLRAADMGWPGMMSIRLHELDGMYDHPSLPMAGDALQLLELQCHSKLAGRRIQRPKKGTTKADAVEDNVESTPAPSLESPLLWLRADPELEYLAELNLLQPEQMWIYQLEKDRDVVGQSQAIAALRAHSHTSFAIVNALNNCLTDTKVFCRVRMEAAAALASTATEATSWAGLQHLIKYYKSCRFDPDIGLPRSNDFHDFAEYFVLEAIPTAVADVRGSDGTSPPEAVDFILTILKHNDNSGNAYSDVFWLASVIESVSSLEFGQQNLQTLLRILKQIDRFLQYDRLMPSYNGVVSISCIHTLTKLALRLSQVLPSERIKRLLQPFTGGPTTTRWQVRVAAMKALVDLEVQAQGLQAAVILAVHFMEADPSLRVQSKVMKHLLHVASNKKNGTLDIGGSATAELLSLLRSSTAFHNVLLRHHLFSFLQVLAGRSAAIYRLVDNKSKATPGQATLEKKSVGNVTSKPGSFKVRLRPTETPLAAPRVEPIKLRLPGRPNLPRDNPDHAESGSSGGKQDVEEQKVGKLKLKIKTSSSSAQEGAGDDMGQAVEVSTGAVTKGPVNVNSPVSLGEVVKQEVEDLSFILQDGTSYEKGMQVKEVQKLEPRYENRMSGGDVTGEDENPQLFEYDNAAVTDSSPRAVGQDRQLSGGRYLLMNVETNGGDSVDHDIEHKSSLSQGSDEGVEIAGADLHQYTSLLEGAAGVLSTHDGGGDDTPSQKQEGERSDKKEKKSEKKEKKDRKERKEKKNKKHDKHNDPEYQEKKRKRREEKDQRHHEGHKSVKVEVKPVDGVVASESAKPDGDTKLRLKIKKPRTNL